MIKKLLPLLLFFIGFTHTFSQEKNKIISGQVLDSLGIVKNANIINQNTKQGTFTNDDGLFRIFVSEGDSLKISSIQHIAKTILITKKIITNRDLTVTLKQNTYSLNEFELKRHNLSGRLGIDTKAVPINKKDSLLSKVMDFSMINFKEKDLSIDANIRAKPPLNDVDPNSKFVGAGASVSMPFKYSERLWALRKELDFKKSFPFKILSELGHQFFFDELKIPIDNYFHFLDYCNPSGIENLYKENNLLEIIKIFRTESEPYLKIKKE